MATSPHTNESLVKALIAPMSRTMLDLYSKLFIQDAFIYNHLFTTIDYARIKGLHLLQKGTQEVQSLHILQCNFGVINVDFFFCLNK
jgi:hypothetical protein